MTMILTRYASIFFLALVLISCSQDGDRQSTEGAVKNSNTSATNQQLTTNNTAAKTKNVGTGTANTGYTVLANPIDTDVVDGVEVLEIFWYGCPHCYGTQPYIKQWEETKPAQAHLVRMPAPLNGLWSLHARIFYTNQAMGLEEELHQATFNALHKEKLRLDSVQKIATYYAENFGVDEEKYIKTASSFNVNLKLQQAENKIEQAGIQGVPVFIVAGKYLVNHESAGSPSNIFSVINALVKDEL